MGLKVALLSDSTMDLIPGLVDEQVGDLRVISQGRFETLDDQGLDEPLGTKGFCQIDLGHPPHCQQLG